MGPMIDAWLKSYKKQEECSFLSGGSGGGGGEDGQEFGIREDFIERQYLS